MTAAAPAARPPRLSPLSGDALFASWSAGTAAAAFFLLVAGGMVTSTGSGLAVPDWPLSYGTLNPPMIGGIFFEHGHRLVAGAVSLLTFALAALSRRAGVPAAARLCASWAAGLIVVQALLGGLTVILRLPPAVSMSHACLGQGVFCLILAAAASARPAGLAADSVSRRVFAFAAAGFAAAYLQLAFGALVRHTGRGLPVHFFWAFGVLACAALASYEALRRGATRLRGPALALACVLPLQIALGLFAYRLRTDPTLSVAFREAAMWRTAHLAGGALTLASFLILSLRARRDA